MSFLVVVPEFLTSAAADVENIGSTLRAANAAAAASTTALAAAGADEVSAAVAALFARFGQEYQAVSAQASAFHQQFVQTLNSASGSYAAAEATIASQLQTAQHDLLGAVNAPTETLLGRPACCGRCWHPTAGLSRPISCCSEPSYVNSLLATREGSP